jgi:excisionase family DNA binding protein
MPARTPVKSCQKVADLTYFGNFSAFYKVPKETDDSCMNQKHSAVKPLLLSKKEVAQKFGVSLPTLQRMIRSGEVPVRKLRRRVLIPANFVRRMVTAE